MRLTIHGVISVAETERLQRQGYELYYDGDNNALVLERQEEYSHELLYAPESPF